MSLDTINKNNKWATVVDFKELYDDENVDLKESYDDENGNGVSDLLERIIDLEISRKNQEHDGSHSSTGGPIQANIISGTATADEYWPDSVTSSVEQGNQVRDITQDPAWLEVYETVSKNIEDIENPEIKDFLTAQLNQAAQMTSDRLNYQASQNRAGIVVP